MRSIAAGRFGVAMPCSAPQRGAAPAHPRRTRRTDNSVTLRGPLRGHRLVATFLSLALATTLFLAGSPDGGPGDVAAAEPPAGGIALPKPSLPARARQVLRGGLGLVAADVRAGRTSDLSGIVTRRIGGRSEVAVRVQVDPGASTSRVASCSGAPA